MLIQRHLRTGCTGQNREKPCGPTYPLFGPLPPELSSVAMYLKRRTRHKDGKNHVYYSLCESLRVSRGRVVQRQVLQLGELNTTQVDAWQRTIEVLHEDGQRYQQRLFTDRDGPAPSAADAVQVRLSTLVVKQPRRFGDCWVGCQLWEELGLRAFWEEHLGSAAGEVPWAKVVELLSVNRLLAPRSELFVHEKWFPQTAMDVLLDTDAEVAGKDRLYRCLDRLLAHKPALEQHLAGRWQDLFNARYELLLYDLTSTYFEGAAEAVPLAQRGYSRDHRPDCKQLVLALIVNAEGFPLTYEVFAGNRRDSTTLDEIVATVEQRHGKAQRVWVFDRGVVSEENLEKLRARGAHYLVGTPKARLADYEQALLAGSWTQVNAQVEVQLIPESDEVYVLCRSAGRRAKERAMRWRRLRGLIGDLRGLRRALRAGQLKDPALIERRLGRLQERHPQVWKWVRVSVEGQDLRWTWDREKACRAMRAEGTYLLRAHWSERDPATLWKT